MRVLIFFAALLMLSGCNGVGQQIPGDGRIVAVKIDDAFREHVFFDGRTEADAVRAGVIYWNSLGANLEIEGESYDHAVAQYAVNRDTFSWPGEHGPWGITWAGLGYSTIYPSDMRNDRSYDFEDMRANVAHEIGHAIGLYHVDGVAAMSVDHNYLEGEPSPADADEYRLHYPIKG